MLDHMAEEINHGLVQLRDKKIVNQCGVFVKDENGKLAAQGAFKDDMVIARAIAGQVAMTAPKRRTNDKDSTIDKYRDHFEKRTHNGGFSYARSR
jgi:hypothetical protein